MSSEFISHYYQSYSVSTSDVNEILRLQAANAVFQRKKIGTLETTFKHTFSGQALELKYYLKYLDNFGNTNYNDSGGVLCQDEL